MKPCSRSFLDSESEEEVGMGPIPATRGVTVSQSVTIKLPEISPEKPGNMKFAIPKPALLKTEEMFSAG